LMKLNMGR